MIVALVVVLSAFLVITGFVFVFSVRRIIDAQVWCPWYVRLIARVWLVVGVVADVVFNWIWGTVIFREFPRELMYTSRVKRHVAKDDWRGEKARRWAEFMDEIAPGHVNRNTDES